MNLTKVRIRDYRSIHDTGWFNIEEDKTILVGPNEAGKTAILCALEAINPPTGESNFEWLRDYPRSRLNDIQTGKIDPSDVTVTEVIFTLNDEEKEIIAEYNPEFKKIKDFVVGRNLDNTRWYRLNGGPKKPTFGEIKKNLIRLKAHIQNREASDNVMQEFESLIKDWNDNSIINSDKAIPLINWLKNILPFIDEDNSKEEDRYERLMSKINIASSYDSAINSITKFIPLFVYFSNYFKVRPSIHLRHFAERIASGILDDETYDFGNKCLLQLLGFTAEELANLGETPEPPKDQPEALKKYKDQLDKRHYRLNAAQVVLTEQIRDVWISSDEEELLRLRLHADRQYLKVVVEDELGVEVELDQRSAGFQWLVSFFVVFRAQAEDEYANAILLLDEPGLSLHGLKQRQFRKTVSKLAVKNQTIYTTHSPFMVGPEELPIVRVVEMTDRRTGTKVHTHITADDPRSLFPLQEALGYDLAQSLFAQQRNLVCEGLTDYWYLEGTAALLREDGIVNLNDKIALVPAKSASKVSYYVTILYTQKLKVAALLDSDQAGEKAATQDEFVRLLGNRRILRTKDFYTGSVNKPEIEDLLRHTLIQIAKNEFGWDVVNIAASQKSRPIVNIFEREISNFTKYKLAKAYLRWVSTHHASDLSLNEKKYWTKMIETINRVLK